MAKQMMSAMDVLLLKIQVLYDVEKVLEKALPKLEKAALDKGLKAGFKSHLAETQNHIRNLEKIFSIMGEKPDPEKSEGIRGIAADSDWVIRNQEESLCRDAMLAGGARYAEHYEMAGYMTAIDKAKILKMTDVVELLKENLKDEIAADKVLAGAVKAALKSVPV
jgi:ferritin-like metal-binding protein YciE